MYSIGRIARTFRSLIGCVTRMFRNLIGCVTRTFRNLIGCVAYRFQHCIIHRLQRIANLVENRSNIIVKRMLHRIRGSLSTLLNLIHNRSDHRVNSILGLIKHVLLWNHDFRGWRGRLVFNQQHGSVLENIHALFQLIHHGANFTIWQFGIADPVELASHVIRRAHKMFHFGVYGTIGNHRPGNMFDESAFYCIIFPIGEGN